MYICIEGSEGKEKINRQLLLPSSAKCCNDKGKWGYLTQIVRLSCVLKDNGNYPGDVPEVSIFPS